MPGETEKEVPRLQLSLVQVIAAALASITSAVILSRFGVAGTYVGTAVGSIVSTVSVAVYSHTMRQARRRVHTYTQHHHAGRVIEAPPVRTPPAAWNRSHPPSRSLPPVTVRTPRGHRGGWRAQWDRMERWFAGLPLWGKAGLMATTAFVVAVAAVVLFQVLSGQSLTNLVRGQTTSSHGVNPSCAVETCGAAPTSPPQTPAPTSVTTAQPTQQPATAPTTQPTPVATPLSTPAATPAPTSVPSFPPPVPPGGP
ncbi:MAG: hypothetical protein J2P43_01945 [Candidatus Dormibacteraeota bacterium]|nr:hypothetical protein [Candidatus Dormibacteraeota bacterium]